MVLMFLWNLRFNHLLHARIGGYFSTETYIRHDWKLKTIYPLFHCKASLQGRDFVGDFKRLNAFGENKSFLWNPTNSCLGMLEFLLWPPKVPSSDLDSPAFTKHTALSEAWRNSLSRGNLPSSISGMKQKKCATGALWGNLICLNFES